MRSHRERNRASLRLEALEGRNAPSGFAMAAATHMHPRPAVHAQVEHHRRGHDAPPARVVRPVPWPLGRLPP